MALLVEHMLFEQRERDEWERAWSCGSGRATLAALRPCFLTEIISAKAAVRPKRFFGEARVAGKWGYVDAWYCSYQWLTSRIWTDGKCPPDEWHRRFKKALHFHFPRLAELQRHALALAEEIGSKPVAPDLWLIRDDEHWFVEAKIWPDDLAESQLVGLAVIATCLQSMKQVRVAIVYLQEESTRHYRNPEEIQQRFEAHCARLRQSNTAPHQAGAGANETADG